MRNCIFTAHCTEGICDQSCPILVETSYLMERNGISSNSSVFHSSESDITLACDVLKEFSGKFGVLKVDDTVKYSELITYCAICQNWRGSRLNCTVYNLKYSTYLDEERKSWNYEKPSDDLEYVKIWSNMAKVLIISNFDYVNFGDFESQKILNLIQTRSQQDLTTIMVCPSSGIVTKSAQTNSFPALLKQRMNAVTFKKIGGGSR